MTEIRGLLIDIDGVLHIDGTPVPGALDALRELRRVGIEIRYLTNGTMRTRAGLAVHLQQMGFEIEEDDILTTVTATTEYVRRHCPGDACHLVVSGDLDEEFRDVMLTDDEAEARVVVVGGAGDTFSYAALNRAYRMLRNGAQLVAMHKSVYWLTSEGVTLDSGPFIHGLEWASGAEAVIVGKPSPHFFRARFDVLGLPPAEVAMVGDDPVQDVQAAMNLGATGVLVRTGLGALEPSEGLELDLVLPSIAELPAALKSLNHRAGKS